MTQDWLDNADVQVENQGKRFYLQIDGNDIVSITDIDREAGTALVTVHKSTHPDADTAWQGWVNIKERQ